jgi:hypothetical protein
MLGTCLIFCNVPVMSLIGAIPGVPWAAVDIACLLVAAAQIGYMVSYVRRLYRGEVDDRQLSNQESRVLAVVGVLTIALNGPHLSHLSQLFQAHFR